MVRATEFFSPIDHDKTIENAKEVLGNYWHHKRLAQRTKIALRSPVMDGMPKSTKLWQQSRGQARVTR
ncbi:Phage encoded transcriptional regulator, ArpU family [Lacticaseibacillus paracasei subsp. paracasei Lpp230]|nr:Phage encoded transcriptional regulator, ArpU family [Lacticaseibacillus paracasei subsp. paracasei Lpp230]